MVDTCVVEIDRIVDRRGGRSRARRGVPYSLVYCNLGNVVFNIYLENVRYGSFVLRRLWICR